MGCRTFQTGSSHSEENIGTFQNRLLSKDGREFVLETTYQERMNDALWNDLHQSTQRESRFPSYPEDRVTRSPLYFINKH